MSAPFAASQIGATAPRARPSRANKSARRRSVPLQLRTIFVSSFDRASGSFASRRLHLFPAFCRHLDRRGSFISRHFSTAEEHVATVVASSFRLEAPAFAIAASQRTIAFCDFAVESRRSSAALAGTAISGTRSIAARSEIDMGDRESAIADRLNGGMSVNRSRVDIAAFPRTATGRPPITRTRQLPGRYSRSALSQEPAYHRFRQRAA